MAQAISLGSHCYAAWLLQRMKLATAPMVFDWISSDPGMVADCLDDDFATLLSPDEYVFVRHEKIKYHGVRSFSQKYGRTVVFSHSDPTTPGGYRYLELCVERMRDAMSSGKPILFLLVTRPERLKPASLDRLQAALLARMPNPFLLSIGVPPALPDTAAPVTEQTEATAFRASYLVKPSSDMHNGLSFRNEADNRVLADLVKRHLPALPQQGHAERAIAKVAQLG